MNIHIGSITIPSHFVFETLSFFLGYRYYTFLSKSYPDKITESNRTWIFIGAALGALIFSRVIGALENPLYLMNNKSNFLFVFANQTIAGGLLGGLFGVELIKKIIGEKNSSGDLLVFPLILGMIIGRIGCFLAGLDDNTFGIATSLPWGIDFGDGVHRHPTNLYEIIFLILLWIILLRLKNTIELIDGGVFKIFMIIYFVFRFITEFIKPEPVVAFGLTTIQLTCLVCFVWYGNTIVNPLSLRKRKIDA